MLSYDIFVSIPIKLTVSVSSN